MWTRQIASLLERADSALCLAMLEVSTQPDSPVALELGRAIVAVILAQKALEEAHHARE